MKLMKAEIKANERITSYLSLLSMQLRRGKNDKDFLVLDLNDKTGSIKGYLWIDPLVAASTLTEKSFVKVRGLSNLLNNSLTINIEKVRPAREDEIDISDFAEVVQGGIDYWYHRLLTMVELIADMDCRRLVDSFLADEVFLKRFLPSPAGVKVHHNYIGGLLEHTVNTMAQSALLSDIHEGQIDKSLLLTGAFLHDIGKTRELKYDPVKTYTTEGKLLGHIAIGISMINEKLSGLPDFPEDISLQLKHMLLAHHGEPNFGSPVRPSTAEALALHMADNTDAKLNHIGSHIRSSNFCGEWSSFDKILNTEIYQKKFSREAPKTLAAEAA